MFSVGDIVCYPMHGIGAIEAIETRDILGSSTEYYILRFVNSRLTAMVPVESAEKVGLRGIIGAEECDAIIQYYKTATPDAGCDNWNQRYRDNRDKLRIGDPYKAVDVILCLTLRDKGRGLSAGECKMLKFARGILINELSVACGREESEIEALLG